MEDKIPLDADHSMIVKFDNKNNRGYTSARDKLRQFEQDAPSVVAARFCTLLPFNDILYRDQAYVPSLCLLLANTNRVQCGRKTNLSLPRWFRSEEIAHSWAERIS
jgi:hypothetical protein